MRDWVGPVLAWLLIACLGLVPPVFRDALNDHLMLPLLWREHGLFWRDTWLSFTANPPLADIPFTMFAATSWDWLASLWHAIAALVVMFLIDACMQRLHLGRRIRLLGMVLWLTTPIVVNLCAMAYVDLWLCVAVAGLCALLMLPDWKPRHAWLFGLCLAAALLIKYSGLPVAVAGMLAMAARWHAAPVRLWSWTWRALLVCVLVAGSWYAGNILLLGSPLYPLDSRFGTGWLDYRVMAYHEAPWWAAMAPLRQFFWGEAGNPRLFDGMLQPLVLLGLVSAYSLRRSPRATALLLLALVYALFALHADVRARYWLPGTVPLYPLAGYALFRFSRYPAWLLAAALVPSMAACITFWSWLAPWQFWGQGREAYLSSHVADYPIQHWARLHLPSDARVYLLWMAGRAYYLRRSYGADFGREGTRLRRTMQPGEKFMFTHVLMNRRLSERTLGDDLGPAWKRWMAGTCLLARQGDFELRRLSACR